MQQYRVNYVLLICLIIGTLLSSGGAYALWLFQLERNAGTLLERAHVAQEEGKIRDATSNYRQYLALRPDDQEARLEYATAYANIADLEDATVKELLLLVQVLESLVRDMPEQKDLQKKLVELYNRFQRPQDAVDHLGLMIDRYPDDIELKTLRVKSLVRANDFPTATAYGFKLIGYDKGTDSFDSSNAEAPHETPVYAELGQLVRIESKDPELADRIMEQMIKENPDSAQAYLVRGLYRVRFDMEDEGDKDILKALNLDPEDADVLVNIAAREGAEKNFEKSRNYLLDGIKKHPEDVRFYQMLAGVILEEASDLRDAEARKAKYQEALDQIELGIKKVDGIRQENLLVAKAELQIRGQDFAGVKETIATLRERKTYPELIDYLDAVVMAHEGKWYAASIAMEKLRPAMASKRVDLRTNLDFQLGLCYEQLGRHELAQQSYELVLQADPTNEPARAGKQRIIGYLGKKVASSEDQSIDQLIQSERQKPKEQQNWDRINTAVDQIADKLKFSDSRRKLMKAEVFLVREDYAQAKKLLSAAHQEDPSNVDIQLAAVRLVAIDPDLGTAKALPFLDKVVAEFGDSAKARRLRAQIVLTQNPQDRNAQLLKLRDGIDDWSTEEKLSLLNDLASKYELLGLRDEAREAWTQCADLAPNDLPVRLRLFILAHDQVDDAAMREAQDRILEIVKVKHESTWLYTEARRLLILYRRGMVGADELPKIHSLLNEALEQRREWHDLYLLQADLAIAEGKIDQAIPAYQRALELGRAHAPAVAQFTRVLASQGQFTEARKVADTLPQDMRIYLLGQSYADIVFNSGDPVAAAEVAKKISEAAPDDPARQFWYSQRVFAVMVSPKLSTKEKDELAEEAEKALRHSSELSPQSPETWATLVRFYLIRQDRDNAEQALREGQLNTDTDLFASSLADSYRMFGRWFDAQAQYHALYDANPTDPNAARALAAYLLSNLYPNDDGKEKAAPYINQILNSAASGVLDPSDRNVLWTKRTAAELLANSGDYQNMVKAERLLSSNLIDGKLLPEDQLRMANILALRPEPASRLKSIMLLEDIRKEQPLDIRQGLTLATLYFKLDRWIDCRQEMLALMRRFPDSPAVIQTYIGMLVDRGTKDDATRAINERLPTLHRLAPNEPMTIALTVRLLHKAGRDPEAIKLLYQQLPAKASDITDEQLPIVKIVADLFVEIDRPKDAESRFQVLASRNPVNALYLAQFYGLHGGDGDVDKAFDIFEKLFTPDRASTFVGMSVEIIRARRDKVGKVYDPLVEKWLDRALLENPDSIPLLMQRAEFYDLQQRYPEAVAIYQQLLERPDLKGVARAIVLNNLSFLLAVSGTNADSADPLEYIEEASDILGPTADVLDTRGVVFTAQKQYDKAIQDLDFSLLDNPTAAKYFHKAVAHYLAQDNAGALKAWNKAVELGLSREDLNQLEHPRYDELRDKMVQLGARSAAYSASQ